MSNFTTNLMWGLVVIVLGGALGVYFGQQAGDSGALGSNQTTFTNPIVFNGTVETKGVLTTTGGAVGPANDLVITSDTTLTAAMSGSDIYIGTAGVDLTLPLATASAGVNYRIVMSALFATTNMTITGGAADASDDLIYGAIEVAGAATACSAEDTISFVNTAELPGDFVELRSNGVLWFVTGQGTTAGSITCTDAD